MCRGWGQCRESDKLFSEFEKVDSIKEQKMWGVFQMKKERPDS